MMKFRPRPIGSESVPTTFSTIESAASTVSPPLSSTAGSTSGQSASTCCCRSGIDFLKKPDHEGSPLAGGSAAGAAFSSCAGACQRGRSCDAMRCAFTSASLTMAWIFMRSMVESGS